MGENRLENEGGIRDIHTHCLPGIDDGAANWDMSLQLLQASWQSGVRTVIATPHFLPWSKEQIPVKTIRDLCREAMERSRRELGTDLRILPGGELYYHDGLVEDLRAERAPTLAGTRTVLVEFSEEVPWSELRAGLIRLLRSGYHPILAHAERYACLRKEERLDEILETGVFIQSNIQEVEAGMFRGPGCWVRRQLRRQTVHFVASDMHNPDRRPPFTQRQLEWLRKKTGEEYRHRILKGNICTQLEKDGFRL